MWTRSSAGLCRGYSLSRRLPACNRRVNAERRKADVETPSLPVLPSVRDQRIGEGECAGAQIARGGGTFVDIEIAPVRRGKTRPSRHPGRLGNAVANERSPIAQHGI